VAQAAGALGDGCSTTDVCAKFVKPATRAGACAYLELLRGRACDGVPAVGRATVFVSHAWANGAQHLAAAVTATLAGEEAGRGAPHYVWYDILSVNQHNATCAQWGCACGSARPLPSQARPHPPYPAPPRALAPPAVAAAPILV